PAFDPEGSEPVRQPVRHATKLGVRHVPDRALLALPPHGHPVGAGFRPPVHAVVSQVDGATVEPHGPGLPARRVQDPYLGPVDRRTQARAEVARPSRGHPFARKLFLATAGVLALALAAGSGAAIWGIRYAEGKVPVLPTGPSCTENGCLKHVTTKCAGQVCYF